MSTVLLVGTGEVAIRAARQLVDTPGLTRLLLASRDPGRARELAGAMGAVAEAVDGPGVTIPDGVDAIAIATDDARSVEWAGAAVRSGVHAAVAGDGSLGGLDLQARAVDRVLVTGCALAPGMSDVLVRHAADAFDVVDEVHVARIGAAGPACAEAVRSARREVPGEWRGGEWHADRAFGPELVWFPEPIGARECQLVPAGIAALVPTVPGARHFTVRFGPAPSGRRFAARLRRDPLDDGWGAVRVELTGRRGGVPGSIVYGLVDRTAVVSGTVLAVAAAGLAGLVPEIAHTDGQGGGVRSLGELVVPVPFLIELARRGVKAAAFEGVAPAA